MKKTALITVLLAASSVAFAELHPSSRYVDIGFGFETAASQNLTGVTDLLVEDLKLNFTEIADSMDDDGLVFDVSFTPEYHIDVNIGENKGGGIFLNTQTSMRFATGKALWDILGHGNAAGNSVSTVAAQGEMFFEAGAKAKFKVGRIGWTVKPVYFVPLYYIPRSEMLIELRTYDTAFMAQGFGSADVNIYSNFDIGSAFGEDLKFNGAGDIASSLTEDISSILASGGVSFNIEAEYQLLNTLCTGIYTEVPVVAGNLKYKNTVHAEFEAHVSPILDSLEDGKEMDKDYSFTKKLTATEESNFKVRVPFRLGAEAAWRPFGDWCTFRPMLGFAVRNPWGDDYSDESVFVEYSLAAEITAFYVLKFNAETLYRNQIFTQRLGFGLNLRVFELDAVIGSSSASFTKSWTISGLNAKVGLHIGF